MKNTEATTIESKVYGTLTKDQAIEILRRRIAEQLAQPRTVALSNGTPKGGWTDADRIR